MIPEWMSWIDVGYVVVALMFAWGGYQRGFATQIAHVLTLITIGLALIFVYPFVFDQLARMFRNMHETVLTWLLLILLAALTVGLYLLFTKLLARYFKAKLSDRSDSWSGFLFGFARGLMIGLFALTFWVILGPPTAYDTLRLKSKVGNVVCYQLVPRIQPQLTSPVLESKVKKVQNKLLQREEAGLKE